MQVERGKCQCGCGQDAPLAQRTDTKRGVRRGEPLRFVLGHSRRQCAADYVVDGNGCWVWQRYVNPRGYGSTSRRGRTVLAHRLYYEQAKGLIPTGMDIDHLCGNKRCVNPDHLEAVSRRENIRRATAVLDSTQVAEILASPDSARQLARRLGVSHETVLRVRRRHRRQPSPPRLRTFAEDLELARAQMKAAA